MHGRINENYTLINPELLAPRGASCRNYILFLSDVLRTREVLGPQITDRVIIIPRSTQWKQQEFLGSKASSDIVNLLVVGESVSNDAKKVNYPSFNNGKKKKLNFNFLGTSICLIFASIVYGWPWFKCPNSTDILDKRSSVTTAC